LDGGDGMEKRLVARLNWILMGWALLGLILYSMTGDLWAAKTDRIEMDLSQKKNEFKKIEKELHQKKVKEKQIRWKESSLLKRIHQVNKELYDKGKELKRIKAKVDHIEGRLEQTKNQIIMLSQTMEKTKERLLFRLNALYKMKKIPREISLFTSESYSDLLKIDRCFRAAIDYDSRLISTYRHQLDLKEKYQEKLIQNKSQWMRSIYNAEKNKKEIKEVRRQNRVLLKSIQNQKIVYQKIIRKLGERAKRLQNLIDKLGRKKNILAYKRSRKKVFKAKLSLPVQGRVISLFKEKGQNGVEIKASKGAEVRAVLAGKILFADWFKGFGNVVIIDHGNHILTVSAYCSKLLKKVGDVVSLGEPIALVGSENLSTGPSLYFEIRHRGKPQDPMEWISILKTQRNPEEH
jgi:septal ring factor EnvC (AmiA/AmiB activator)